MATTGTEITAMPMGVDAGARSRCDAAEALSRLLADTFAVYLKTHGFHWNVTGPRFHSLHALFEEQYRELWLATDSIAERIRALGFAAPGGYGDLSSLASVGEAEGVPDADGMLRQLLRDHETAARTARQAFGAAEVGCDAPTADLVTQRIGAHERAASMLRSMLAKQDESPQ